MRFRFLFFFLVVLRFCGTSQTPGDLPVIVPPSPELASLANVGQVSTSLHTGGASVNVPLYEIKAGAITVPVALSYFTNGVKVNDIASRVGLGWNLVAGGNVSRTIHDEEDGGTSTVALAPPANLNPVTGNTALITYLKQSDDDHYDTEHDEYSFSVGGISGKFFIDDTGVPRLVNHEAIKIQKTGTYFVLTTADGIKYYFGTNSQVEKTKGYQLNGVGRWDRMSTTGWFLTSIISPQGDTVVFNYNDIFIKTIQGASQSVILLPGIPPTEDAECDDQVCLGRWSDPIPNRLDYDTKYLTSIVSNNGQQVYFIYETRGDDGLDNRLKRIAIHANDDTASRMIKSYEFEYQDHPISGDWNMRFYLKKLYQVSTRLIPNTIQPDETLVHQFEYNDPAGLPSQRSYCQDYFGYANAATPTTNVNLFPKPANYAQYARASEGANRSPDFANTVKGSLSKVTFPTGGYQQFFYEPHTLADSTVHTTYLSSDYLNGTGLNTYTMDEYQSSITLNGLAKLRFVHHTYNNPSGPYPGQTNYWTPDNLHPIAIFQIIKTSTGAVVHQSRHDNYLYTDTTVTAGLEPNTDYTIKLQVWGVSVMSTINLDFAAVDTTEWTNEPVCGMRVQKIVAYDPVSRSTNKQFYRYASVDDLTKSSGVGLSAPITQATYRMGGPCVKQGHIEHTFLPLVECTGMIQLSSSAINGGFTFNGSPVAYQYVTESNDSLDVNGVTEHEFETEYNNTIVQNILGIYMPGGPADVKPSLNGTEVRTRVFKKNTTPGFTLLNEARKIYKIDPRHHYWVDNYLIRQRWNPDLFATIEEKAAAFDLGKYQLSSYWFHLDTVYTTEYDQDGQNPVSRYTAYEYGSTDHWQMTKQRTVDSRDQVTETQYKYPHDYPTSPYTDLVTKNIISPVIEEKNLVGGTQVGTVQTDYASWFSGSILQPQVVKVGKATDAPVARLRYYSYDEAANPTELSKENGARISYLWGYDKNFVIAEVKNAALADIAYTSFENGSYGQWEFNPGNFIEEGFTGAHSYAGSMSKTVIPSQTYIVTAWYKGTGTRVNDLNGEVLATKRGWTLRKWVITGAIKITIKSGQMDEVRLYPLGAQMISYVYNPFIGLSWVDDANNGILYYTYDGLNRLELVRDIDSNIVKQHEYKYNQTISPCANIAADWEPTSRTRCVMSGNNYSGEQEAEERDQNNCSASYLQTRWVSLGVTGQCAPVPNCGRADQRVVNGVCEIGTKVLISSAPSGNRWNCTYKYVWSDGYESAPFTQLSLTRCEMGGPIEL